MIDFAGFQKNLKIAKDNYENGIVQKIINSAGKTNEFYDEIIKNIQINS
jgi:hypothetical protein